MAGTGTLRRPAGFRHARTHRAGCAIAAHSPKRPARRRHRRRSADIAAHRFADEVAKAEAADAEQRLGASTRPRCKPSATAMQPSAIELHAARFGSRRRRGRSRRASTTWRAAVGDLATAPPPASSAACSPSELQKRVDGQPGRNRSATRSRDREAVRIQRSRAAIAVRGAERSARRTCRQLRVHRGAWLRPHRHHRRQSVRDAACPNGRPPCRRSSHERCAAGEEHSTRSSSSGAATATMTRAITAASGRSPSPTS